MIKINPLSLKQEEMIENIKEELIKNNNEILKEISEKLHMY